MKVPFTVILYLRELDKNGIHFTIEVDKYKRDPGEKASLMYCDIKLEKTGTFTSFAFTPLSVNFLAGNISSCGLVISFGNFENGIP
jgi:hypothetical protein